MQHTALSLRGIVSAPHHLAAQSGLSILKAGGNAIEAAIAACASCAVLYPHRNGLAGDGFWLIHEPGKAPVCIDGSGMAGSFAKAAHYREQGLTSIPKIGPLAAATTPGLVSGWQAALDIALRWEGSMKLPRLFDEAIHYAAHGVGVTDLLARSLCLQPAGLTRQPAFAAVFAGCGKSGQILRQPGMALLLETLARSGLDDFYRGAVGRHLAEELRRLGCPISSTDLARQRSVRRRPLSAVVAGASLYSPPPPSQGLVTLIMLGCFARMRAKSGGNFGVEQIHALVEASKIALEIRDRHITDPTYMAVHATTYIADPVLDRLARSIDAKAARGSSMVASPDEAVWIGVIDGHGRAVSVTQGLRTAWGSGVVVGEFGLLWHNSAIGFSLDESAANPLTPGRKPPQTLAPALARFKDGRVMPFGSSGGDTQPQTLAGLFGRYALFGENLQEAVSAPRWRLEPGQSHSKLWLESGIRADIEVGLARIGHSIALVEGIDSQMGQAGALLRHENGLLEGAFDPRSDGAVAAF